MTQQTRCAKIVATLGPASANEGTMEAMVKAGASVFRLNFSHGTHADHERNFDTVRRVERTIQRPIAVLADLQGPKLRLGQFVGGSTRLMTGQTFHLDLSPELGDSNRVNLPHPEIFSAIEAGTDLLLDDGKLRLRVESVGDGSAVTRVVTGGTISDNKGLNVPKAVLPISALTPKDRRDLDFALHLGVDWVALSFVQRPEDVAEIRKLVAGRAGVISKLEKPSALDSLDEIIELSDAVMVARGDLGVEIPPERVPTVQKRIIRACRSAGKPVVVATQMLESMIHAPTPTRAEASDVATAIYDAADAVMLSAETSVGEYPVAAVDIMNRIIRQVEADENYRDIIDAGRHDPENSAADAICAAARQVARTLSAALIVSFTTSGSTALRAARERPSVPILCVTPRPEVARRTALVWGIKAVVTEELRSFSDMVDKAVRYAATSGLAESGQRLVIIAGVPFGRPGTTNNLRIAWVD
ncbi:pyruvate kinase [Roseospira marina]|uniref:Pyruvate kinase n=1 Tax=Roseospira marina TaxID=140057 RepID=A0A5M6IHG8_9PROT|nr:pyruvate kinase [Roseospira marina]KAA5607008.1 pyruvate kinase [Roseospira marina]MBB4312808.1 pyruvate kinase [Roseospira marina]MBB5086419.1 pyruvate kinase [Roseospira marina]